MDEAFATAPPSGQTGEDSRTQQFWGSRYIDNANMFRTKVREGSGETRRSDQDFAAGAYGEPL